MVLCLRKMTQRVPFPNTPMMKIRRKTIGTTYESILCSVGVYGSEILLQLSYSSVVFMFSLDQDHYFMRSELTIAVGLRSSTKFV